MRRVGLVLAVLLVGAAIALLVFRLWRPRSAPVVALPTEALELPAPRYDGAVSVEAALRQRRSIRDYTSEPLSLADISQLLWAAQGVTDVRGYRTAPSAGATYPLEVYVVVRRVDGLGQGVYKYHAAAHALVPWLDRDVVQDLTAAALSQAYVREAALNLVFTAVYERTRARYGYRGTQYVHMEVGHAGQNVYLQAAALDLGTVAIGAFEDARVKAVLALPADEEPLYIMPVGRPARASR